MIFISEDIINAVIAESEKVDGDLDGRIETLKESQPVVLAYITSEQFDMLNDVERDYLVYLTQVLVQSVSNGVGEIPILEENEIGSTEEQVWAVMENAKGKTFRDRLDVFFDKYPQEDLLAFVEDSLVEEEEEDDITTEGRELMFVALKTMIDVFHTEA